MKNTKIMTALVVLLAAALFIGAASAADYINVSSGNTTFVFEKVNLTDGTESGTLTLFSEGSTPAAVNTIYADSYGNGANFSLYESSVNGHYGVYYNTSNYSKVENGEAAFVYIWYPEISLKAELTTDLNGATSGDSIDGKTINKDTVVSFLINTPYVGPVNASKDFPDGRFVTNSTNLTAKIIFTTPAGGKTTVFNTTYPSFANVNLNQAQNLAGYTKAGSDAPAGTWTAQAEFTGYDPFADNAKKSNTISFTLQSTTLTITAAKDSVVRSNPFTVAIQGESKHQYAVYIESPAAKIIPFIIPTSMPYGRI